MTFTRSEHPEATEELLSAIRYYEEHAGAGADFTSMVQSAVRDVVTSPLAWPPLPGRSNGTRIRTRSIAGYPHRVVYYVRGEVVIIIAFAHTKRRPEYWRERLSA